MTVLICDDETRLSALTAGLLAEHGFVALTVKTADEAISVLAAETRIDVLLLDVNLSAGRTARELLVAMADAGQSTRVVLTSGLAEEDVEPDLLSHPMVTGYVPKPFGVDQLLVCMRRAIATAEK